MRQTFPNVSLERLCALFGVSRQAYYEAQAHNRKTTIANSLVLGFVHELRNQIPLIGTRKLYHLIIPQFEIHGIKMGRDQLFDLLRFHGLLVRRRRRMVKTTDSHHWLKKYPNLTTNLIITGVEQLWVSDITEIKLIDISGRIIIHKNLTPDLGFNHYQLPGLNITSGIYFIQLSNESGNSVKKIFK